MYVKTRSRGTGRYAKQSAWAETAGYTQARLPTMIKAVAVRPVPRSDAAGQKGSRLNAAKDEVGNVSKRQAGCRMPENNQRLNQFAVK